MRSRRPKVLHQLAHRPLICRVLDVVRAAGVRHVVVVLGHHAEQVQAVLPADVDTVLQTSRLGTGHAVQVAADQLKAYAAERVLVHLGDEALVRVDSLRRLVEQQLSPHAPIALLNAQVSDPFGYGRVIRLANGDVDRMVEEADASTEDRAVNEVWSGSMLVWAPWLWEHIERLPRSPKGEYYLPELVNLARDEGRAVHAVLAQDEEEVLGINDRGHLARAEAILRQRTIQRLQQHGVTIIDPATTYIDPDVEIEPDAIVEPGCHLLGNTRIAADCVIGPNSYIVDSEIGAGSRVWLSVLEGARVGQRVEIGPMSHLRPGAVIEDEVTLGNYAEVKASRVGAGTQMHHFSYVGDAEIGEGVNIGAGTITVNYSSETRAKSRTTVGDGASIGSDTMLVAPVNVGEGAMTGAGSVITRDIPAGEVWVGAPARRLRQRRGQEPAT
jgi:bifunctional UDP-N-acetylglucosamine pyrophosphorylase / glucosamine-1-phosphate N-acetyltransferase